MRSDYFYESDIKWVRVTKKRARRAFNNGGIVRIAPVNASMHHGIFTLWCDIQKDYYSCEGYTFEQIMNHFEYYNLHQGAGNYSKYYIQS